MCLANALQEIAAEVNGIRAARESLEARETTFTTAIDTINTMAEEVTGGKSLF